MLERNSMNAVRESSTGSADAQGSEDLGQCMVDFILRLGRCHTIVQALRLPHNITVCCESASDFTEGEKKGIGGNFFG